MPSSRVSGEARFVGNDRVLFGIIFGRLSIRTRTPMVYHPRFILDQGILPGGAACGLALTEG